MKNVKAHSPIWASSDRNSIDLMIIVEYLPEEVCFTAAPYDLESHGRELYEQAINGAFGEIAEYRESTKTLNQLAMIEDQWRVGELDLIADQLLALEDCDPMALPIAERKWREYRTEIRRWKQGAIFFPDASQRPIRPL